MDRRNRIVESAVFLTAFCVYLALAVWMNAHWQPLGDEPHYLLAAHSLAADGDLNLANNYTQQDYKNFMRGETLDPHIKLLVDGTQILNHDPGLPVVLALPYALGRRLGVEIFLAFCGALLAWQMFKLAYDVTGNARWSALAAFLLAFTPPLVLYATLIYPEVIGALIFVWAARTILFQSSASQSKLKIIALGVVIGFLPWLSVRFVILAALLILFVALRWSAERKRVLILYAIVGSSFLAYLVVNNILLAGIVPEGNPTDLATGNLATFSVVSITRGIVGWWIDPQRGTLIMAPVYILALAGVPRLLKRDFRTGLLLLSPLMVLIPLVAVLGGFWIPFEVGARYFVVALPLLAAPLALAFHAGFENPGYSQWGRIALGGLTTLLVGLSLWNGGLMITDASYAYGSVVSAYNRIAGSDLSTYFAGMGRALLVTPTNTPLADDSAAVVVEQDGELVWRVPAKRGGAIIRSFDMTELTVGHYVVGFRARAEGGDANAEALALDIYSAEGLPLVHSAVRVGNLQTQNRERVTIEFDNPYFDRWGFPLTLGVVATGEAEVVLGEIRFDPDNPTTWLRAALWLGVIFGIILVLNLDLLRARSPSRPTP